MRDIRTISASEFANVFRRVYDEGQRNVKNRLATALDVDVNTIQPYIVSLGYSTLGEFAKYNDIAFSYTQSHTRNLGFIERPTITDIKQHRKGRMTLTDIADLYGVSLAKVKRVMSEHGYRYLRTLDAELESTPKDGVEVDFDTEFVPVQPKRPTFEQIKADRAEGMILMELAYKYNVSTSTIGNVLKEHGFNGLKELDVEINREREQGYVSEPIIDHILRHRYQPTSEPSSKPKKKYRRPTFEEIQELRAKNFTPLWSIAHTFDVSTATILNVLKEHGINGIKELDRYTANQKWEETKRRWELESSSDDYDF